MLTAPDGYWSLQTKTEECGPSVQQLPLTYEVLEGSQQFLEVRPSELSSVKG